MNKHKSMILCLLLLLIYSCSTYSVTKIKQIAESETATVTSTPHQIIATITPSITHLPIQTISPTLATPTLVPTKIFTPTRTSPVQMKANCLEIIDNLPNDITVEGVIVLNSFLRIGSPAYLFDINTGVKIQLPQAINEQFDSFAVSTDGKWLAYVKVIENQSSNSRQLIITAGDGQSRKIISRNNQIEWLLSWLNHDNLIIHLSRELYDTLLVLNPFNGQQQEFSAGNYRNIDIFYNWGRGTKTPLIFDPTLNLLLYAALRDGIEGVILWNEKTKQEVLFLPINEMQIEPEWSPDASQVVIKKPVSITKTYNTSPTEDELYSISRDGTVIRLTYLTDYYQKVNIGPISWSPDGHYIAFWVDVNPIKKPDYEKAGLNLDGNLAVLDLVSQEVTNYCIPFHSLFKPIWSPDSHHVLLWNYNHPTEHVILVDVKNNFAVQIAEDTAPWGWMAYP